MKSKYEEVIAVFAQTAPFARTELEYETAFQLLIAVVLSAQCTDKRVNMVTRELFKKVSEPSDMHKMTFNELSNYVKSINYHNTKTRNLLSTAQLLCQEHGGVVPNTFEALLKLPGVGRKTANVVLGELFKHDVIAVDTHVFRVSSRLGLVHNARTPLEAEVQLSKNITTPGLKPTFHHWLILHGRYVCKARKPLCSACKLRELCVYYETDRGRTP